jgi:hypothetical protein
MALLALLAAGSGQLATGNCLSANRQLAATNWQPATELTADN